MQGVFIMKRWWRKVKCFFGWHAWETYEDYGLDALDRLSPRFYQQCCYCGAIK